MNDKDTVVDTYAARRDAVMRGLASFCESTPDFDMSARMRRSAAEHILGMVDLAAAPSTSVREGQLIEYHHAVEALVSVWVGTDRPAQFIPYCRADANDAADRAAWDRFVAARAALKPSTDKGGEK